MATYEVAPLPDQSSKRGSWKVEKNGRFVSNHLTKQKALSKARSKAGPRDNIRVKNTDGQYIR